MTNKIKVITFCLFIYSFLSFFFISCENPTSVEPTLETVYYTVTFNSDGGSEVTSQTIEKGKTASKPNNPTKEGYIFSDWYNGSSIFNFSTPINSDIILTAKWIKNSTNEPIYTVTFNMNDGSQNPTVRSQIIQENRNTSLKTVSELSFSRLGYVFTEWNTKQDGTGSKYSDGAEITLSENLTLYAQWTEGNGTRYTVKYYQQNITDDNYTLSEADTQILTGVTNSITNASAKTYEGFTVQSFNQKTISPDGSTVIEIYYNRNIVTLSFSANGGTWSDGTTTDKTISGKYGANVTVPDLPMLTDYTGHWDSEVQTVFLEDMTYSVVWVENTKVPYKVTYMLQALDDNGYQGKNTDTFYGIPGELTEAQPIEIEGFVLSPTHSITQKTITADGKTSVWIYYDRITITLTFKSNGEKWWDNTTADIKMSGIYGATVMYNKASGQSTPLLLEKEGYETIFDKTVQTIFTIDETYIASYNPISATYQVKHWQENVDNDNYTLFETETLSGIVGSKTQASIKSYTGFAKPTENPNYLKTVSKDGSTTINIYYKRNLISLTFSANGGIWSDGTSSDKTIKGKYGATVSENLIPKVAREGYNFISWDNSLPVIFEKSATYAASWTKMAEAQYTVKHWKQNIEDDEYTLATDDTQILNGTVSLQTSAQSKNYAGFNAKTIDQKTISEDGSTVVNIYYDRDIITLTFVSYNSTKTQTGKYGASVSVPSVTRSRYVFTGWDKEVQETYSKNETYTAQWKGEKYTVTFNANSGIGENVTQEFTYGEPQKLLKNTFTKDAGYRFVGWSKTQNSTDKDYSDEENYSVTGNTTLYAVWDAIAVTESNIAAVIENPEAYVNGKTVIANPILDNGKKVDYRINMTGTITDDTLEIIKTAIVQQKEKELCLDMKMTAGIAVLKQYSFMDTVVSTGEKSHALKVLFIPDCITTIETGAIMAQYLEDVYLSNALVEIKPGAFYKPGGLSFVYFMQIDGWYSYTDAAHTKNEKLIDVTHNDSGEFQNARSFKCLENYEPWGSLYLYYKGL